VAGQRRRLQAKDYKIQVPTGLSDVHIREPNFVDVAAMAARSKEHAVGQGSALSIVNGLVTRDSRRDVREPGSAVEGASGSKNGPGQFQFQGGEVFLELRLALYVIQHVQPDPKDSISKQILRRGLRP
jgi:hypothetical protein